MDYSVYVVTAGLLLIVSLSFDWKSTRSIPGAACILFVVAALLIVGTYSFSAITTHWTRNLGEAVLLAFLALVAIVFNEEPIGLRILVNSMIVLLFLSLFVSVNQIVWPGRFIEPVFRDIYYSSVRATQLFY